MNEIITTKDGRKLLKCHACGRLFALKKNNKIDGLGILDLDGTMKFQCIGCSGGYEATESYLKVIQD